MLRELLAEREARRQQAHAERWRAGASSDRTIERVSPIAVPTSSTGGLATPAGDPSNSDMERRPFFRVLGAASGAVLAETLGVELWDLPSDQRIGPIDQRARDLLRELEPWRSTPAVATLAERLATR